MSSYKLQRERKKDPNKHLTVLKSYVASAVKPFVSQVLQQVHHQSNSLFLLLDSMQLEPIECDFITMDICRVGTEKVPGTRYYDVMKNPKNQVEY